MSFKQIIQKNLKISNSELLPASYQQIGDICIVGLNKKLLKNKKKIGKAILDNFKHFRSILNKKSGISGKKRIPNIEIIAGSNKTETIHNESGIRYKLDPMKVMFSKGNINERHRIAKLVNKNEIVVDMFAGIGYFTVPIAKRGITKMIYASEINPVSYKYLNENLKINKVYAKFETYNIDCKKMISALVKKGIKANRILMGLLPSPKKYLKDAKRIVKDGTIIHYEAVSEDPKKLEIEIKRIFPKSKIKNIVKVKSYRPGEWHFTLDIECKI
jgi:tRNA wybutosine-synthesizing protein 2